MKKKILFILFFLLVLVSGAYLYINTVFLPIQLKEIIVKKAREALGRDVSYKEISYSPLKGVTIRDISISQKDNPKIPFITIEEVYGNILLPALLKEQKFVIPSITIRRPYVHLVRTGENEWNFSDLLTTGKNTPKKSSFPVLLGAISIEDGRIGLTDQTISPVSMEIFEQTNCRAGLSLYRGIKFDLETHQPQKGTLLKAKGSYHPFTKDISAQITVQKLDAARYLALFPANPSFRLDKGFIEQADFSLTLKKDSLEARGNAAMRLKLFLAPDKDFEGDILAKNLTVAKQGDKIEFASTLSAKNTTIVLAENKFFRGNLNTRHLKFSLVGQDLVSLFGDLELSNARLQLDQDKKFSGNLTAKELEFNRRADGFNAKLVLNVADADLQLSPEQRIQGNFSIPKLVLNLKPDGFVGQGAISGQNVLAQMGDNILSGNISANEISIDGPSLDNYQATGQLEIQDLSFKAAPSFSLKGQLTTSPATTLTVQEEKINLTTSLQLKEARLTVAKDSSLAGNISLNESLLSFSDGKVDFQSRFTTELTSVRLNKEMEFRGNPDGIIKLRYNPQNENPLSYNGSLVLNSASLTGVPQANEIKDITGQIDFETDKLKTNALRVSAFNTPLSLSGTVKNFSDPSANLKVTAQDVDIATLTPYLKPYLKGAEIIPSGTADIQVSYAGPLASPDEAKITATAQLSDAALEGKKLPDKITAISGLLTYSADSLSWEELKGTFQGKSYTLTGSLMNFSQPTIDTQLVSRELNISTKFKMVNDSVSVSLLSGRYYDSSFDLKGKIFLQGSSPDLDIKGRVDLNLSDLAYLLPQKGRKKNKSTLAGTAAADIAFKGNINNIPEATFTVSATSPDISVSGYHVSDLSLKAEKNDRTDGELKMNALVYKGKLTVSMTSDLTKKDFPSQISAELSGTDLSEINKEGKWKGQNVSGTLSANLSASGPLKKTEEITGSGYLSIANGHLWELNLLQGLWKALLIPEFEGLVFTDASANFTIHDSKIMTNDLTLKGQSADLLGKGSIGFDHSLNLDVAPNFKETEILQSASMKKGLTNYLTQGNGYLNIKITGTIEHPSYKTNSLPTKILEKTGGDILNSVQGVLENIINR